MSTYLILVAIAILIVAMILTLLRYSGQRERRPTPQPATRRGATSIRQRTRWRAVRIKPGLTACNAVQQLTGRVFLADESPHLPLGDCQRADCRCKYLHLEDRRSGGDRRIDLGSLGDYLPSEQSERRRGADRRARGVPA